MKRKTILIFTGGGLAPALNATLYGAITAAKRQGFKILGGIHGWACLLDNGRIVNLTDLNLESIKKIGGTFLKSSRTNPCKIKDGINQIKAGMKRHQIDYVIAVGGNDTMGTAEKLFQKHNLPVVGIPKTVDNDLPETYWTPGFPSAAYYLASYVKEIKEDAAYALSRIFIVESQGQNAGWLAASSIYGGADIIIPPEKITKIDKFLKLAEKKYKQNNNFAVVVVAEEARFDQSVCGIAQDQNDSFNIKRHSFTCLPLRKLIKEKLGIDSKALVPGNYIESGRPIKIDQEYAIRLGRESVNLIKQKKIGYMARLEKKSGKIIVSSIALQDIFKTKKIKVLDDQLFDFENLRPKKEFLDYMEPILGKYKTPDSNYSKLIKKINR